MDAHHSIEEMPKRRKEGKKVVTTASGEDRISAQPDDVLLQVLSLLPSEEVVQTCVLSRRWRHLWKSTPTLRIARDGDRPWSVEWLDTFLTRLMLLRDSSSPLDECVISCRLMLCCGERWIRGAVQSCQTRVLKACMITHQGKYLTYFRERLVSQHLTTLHLTNVGLGFFSVHLSSCPALEDLELNSCTICAEIILSRSLKRLSMTACDFEFIPHTTISAPSLTSLKLDDLEDFFPLLESMPQLVTAFVRLGDRLEDAKYLGDCGDDDCLRCYGNDDDDDGYECALLQSLSSAVDLELIIQPEVFVFRKDFKCPPMFSKLKTLLLSEWRVEADFSALIYFLRHSPTIEKLTLQLCKTAEFVVEANGCYNPRERFLASKHLKIVDVNYHDDHVLHQVLKILSTYGVPPETIRIQKMNS